MNCIITKISNNDMGVALNWYYEIHLKENVKMDVAGYVTWDATEMARLIREKHISYAELVGLRLTKLKKVKPSVNGTTPIREEQVLVEAREGIYAHGARGGVPKIVNSTHALT